MMKQIDHYLVRSLLAYDAETGVFTWRPRPVTLFNATPKRSPKHACANWNARMAGNVAGATNGDGYVYIKIFGRLHAAHRLAFLIKTGRWPPEEIDHRNGVRTDNRFENLRCATKAENAQNLGPKKNKSGFVGVSWNANSRAWLAHMRIDGKSVHLGQFSTPEAAAEAYREAKRKNHKFQPELRTDQ